MGWAEYCTEYIGNNAECGEQATEKIEGFWYCAEHADRMHGLEAMAEVPC